MIDKLLQSVMKLIKQPSEPAPAAPAPAPKVEQPPAAQSVSVDGVNLIKSFEGLYLKAYRDVVNVLTIGYGHTGADVAEGQEITEAEAVAILRADLARFEAGVRQLVTVPLTQGQFDALVSFSFNCGLGNLRSSTMLKLVNASDFAGAAGQFERWNKAGGKVFPGLTRRRAAECAMFMKK